MGTEVSTTPGTVTPTAIITANQLTPGTIKVSIFDTAEYTGSGTVVTINMNVIGATGTDTDLEFTEVLYNGGTVCSTFTDGSLTVVATPTTTAVTSSLNPSVFGDLVTFTATVSSMPGVGNNGTVNFVIDGNPVCTNVAVTAGSATCQT